MDQVVKTKPFNRVLLIVLDSLGVGPCQDSIKYGDEAANTLTSVCRWNKKNNIELKLSEMSQLGFDKLCPDAPFLTHPKPRPTLHGSLEELSPGKDTTTGHWEMMGTPLNYEFPTFPKGFKDSFLKPWLKENSLGGFLGNYPASGTEILKSLGEKHIETGHPIIYTSADSVLQIACHEEHFGLNKLYSICESARKLLMDLGLGRVIARPFLGQNAQNFKRTENRKDYSLPPPNPNVLDILREHNHFVAGVGKIDDIFAHRSVNLSKHTGRNETSYDAIFEFLEETKNDKGLIFVNLIDFDQLYGHRRDPKGYGKALEDFDIFLEKLHPQLDPNTLVILSADHGNDPLTAGSDHTREKVPFIAYNPHREELNKNIQTQMGFSHIGRMVLDALNIKEQTKHTKALKPIIQTSE